MGSSNYDKTKKTRIQSQKTQKKLTKKKRIISKKCSSRVNFERRKGCNNPKEKREKRPAKSSYKTNIRISFLLFIYLLFFVKVGHLNLAKLEHK